MPYITEGRRIDLLKSGHDMEGSGELNYIITRILNRYVEQRGESYQTFNDIVGALECAKLEYYRRVIAPYEAQKAHDNGDVYP